MKNRIAVWMINWLISHYPNYWEVEWEAANNYITRSHFETKHKANNHVREIMDCPGQSIKNLKVKHYVNLYDLGLIEIRKDYHCFVYCGIRETNFI